jgi:hypothetical protein
MMVIDVYVLSTEAGGNVGVYQYLDQAYKDAKKVLSTDNIFAAPAMSFEHVNETVKDLGSVRFGHLKPMHGQTQVKIERMSLALDDLKTR